MSKLCVIFSILILLRFYGLMTENPPCVDWESYINEKCFKIFDLIGLQNVEDADKLCHQQDNNSNLISIRSQEEQNFIYNFLFKTHKVVDNVWIGAKSVSNHFKWCDDSEMVFTNWADGHPKNETDHCVQLIADEDMLGLNKNNLVTLQTLSIIQIQNILLEVKNNLVPIGFIYVQLPNEKSPTEIWSGMTWKDITSGYSGHFFRVEGGASSKFGEIQNENTQSLQQFENTDGYDINGNLNIQPGEWSKSIYSGHVEGGKYMSLKFYVSGGEVRPRNMAIRIWKRLG